MFPSKINSGKTPLLGNHKASGFTPSKAFLASLFLGLCLLGVVMQEKEDFSENFAADNEVKIGEPAADVPLYVECFYQDNPGGDSWMQDQCYYAKRNYLGKAGGFEITPLDGMRDRFQMLIADKAKNRKYNIFIAAHGSESQNTDFRNPKTKDGAVLAVIGDKLYSEIIGLLNDLKAAYSEMMVTTNACYSAYLLDDTRYQANPFPIIVVPFHMMGSSRVSADKSIIEWSPIADVVSKRIGVDVGIINFLADKPQVIAKLKSRVRQMVNHQQQMSVLFDFEDFEDFQYALTQFGMTDRVGGKGTKSWMWSVPSPGQSFHSWNIAPMYWYFTINYNLSCQGVKQAQPVSPGGSLYHIYATLGSLANWGIPANVKPIVNIQTYKMNEDNTVKIYKDQVNSVPDLWDPATGNYRVTFPPKLCSDSITDVTAITIRLQWSISDFLNEEISSIIAADAPKQTQTVKARTATYEKRVGLLRKSMGANGLDDVVNDDIAVMRNMKNSIVDMKKNDQQIHSVFANLAADVQDEMDDEEDEH